MRRSIVAASAALAVGGTLAVTATASAMQIPTGSPTDTGTTTLYGLLNNSYTGLKTGDQYLYQMGDTKVPAYPSFPAESALTAAEAQQIAADFTNTTINGTAPSSATYAAMLATADANYATDAKNIGAAGASWGSLSSLVGLATLDPTDFPGGLFTVDGDVSVSSSAVVTGLNKPTAYTASFGVSGPAQTGFVLPAAFTLTFPASFNVNTALVAHEIQASQESNPPASSAIGTATVTSPEIAALVPGSKGVDSTAAVYVVQTASLTQPDFEVYLGQGDYILGTLAGVTFPLTVSFGEPIVNGVAVPLPVSNVSMSFPASTSPLKAKSCNNLGTLTGTMTDAASALAAQFGDTADSGAVAMAATATTVLDECPARAVAAIGGIKKGKPTLRIRLVGNGGTPFTNENLTLPNGLMARGLKAKGIKVHGAKLRRVIGHGRKITLIFRGKTKSATVFFAKGIGVTARVQKLVAKHKIKRMAISYTVRYTPAGAAAAASSAATVVVKRVS